MTAWDNWHKQAARDADARIVARGGNSVFGVKPLYPTSSRTDARYPRKHELGIPDYSAPVKGKSDE